MIIKTLRLRLALFYSIGVALLLIVFGVVSYYSLQQSIFKEHDRSLDKNINTIAVILNSKLHPAFDKSLSPVFPKKSITQLADSIIEVIQQRIVDSSILSSKNNYIQVFSPEDTIIHESANLGNDDLPVEESQLNKIVYKTVEDFKGSQIRLAAYKTINYTIAIGMPLKETMITLNNLITIFSLLIPSTLIILIVGGWYLTNRSLKPIDDISKTAQEITTKHLHKRIVQSKNEDEIGRLILTLNNMIDRLEKSFEKIQQFSADASHELRTPLTILIGELQNALQKDLSTKEYQEVISNSIDEIFIMSKIIEDLLTLYKADSDQINLLINEINLNEMMSEIYEDSQIISMKKKITVSMELKDNIKINGDKIRLRQLFLNLIENAVKYSPEMGEIKILLKKEDQNAVISIMDSGIGIPEDVGDKIFDRFYRVDKARTRIEGGTGLGLSISKWIAESHGGKLEYKSKVDKGSSFNVYLPLI
jgi:two-component system, OmpR family, sensor kinase